MEGIMAPEENCDRETSLLTVNRGKLKFWFTF